MAHFDGDTEQEISAILEHRESATSGVSFFGLFPTLMRKTVFFFVSFHRRAMQAWILFLVSLERGAPMPGTSLASLAG